MCVCVYVYVRVFMSYLLYLGYTEWNLMYLYDLPKSTQPNKNNIRDKAWLLLKWCWKTGFPKI